MDSFSEIFGSLFTWNEPVARLRYFLNHIFIFFFGASNLFIGFCPRKINFS